MALLINAIWHSLYLVAYKNRREVVSEKVRAALADRAITQLALAEVTGIPERTLARRLAGKSNWTIDELDSVADALGVRIVDLVATTADAA